MRDCCLWQSVPRHSFDNICTDDVWTGNQRRGKDRKGKGRKGKATPSENQSLRRKNKETRKSGGRKIEGGNEIDWSQKRGKLEKGQGRVGVRDKNVLARPKSHSGSAIHGGEQEETENHAPETVA